MQDFVFIYVCTIMRARFSFGIVSIDLHWYVMFF